MFLKAQFLFLLIASAISYAPSAYSISVSQLCAEVTRADGYQPFEILDSRGKVAVAKSRTPNVDEPQPAPVMPAGHTEARIQHTITNNDILRRKSNRLINHFTEKAPEHTEKNPKYNVDPYDKSRYRKVVIKGIGPHAAAVLFGMYETLGGKMSVFGFNKGAVVSEGVFGNPDPRNPHMTAELRTLSQFADNVNPFGGPTQLDFAGLPFGSAVPSSVIADMVVHGLARSAAEVMMKSEVVQTIPRKAVEEAKRLAKEYPTGLDAEVYRLANEPAWPEDARYMHYVDITVGGQTSRQQFFSDHVVVGTGLGPPRVPFFEGKVKMANGKPMRDQHGKLVYEEGMEPSAEWLLAKEELAKIRPGAPRPKNYVPRIHEASSFFGSPKEEVLGFMEGGETFVYGGGYSSVVAMNRMFEFNPNPKPPIHMITRNPLDPVKDSVTIAYINWANSDLHLTGLKKENFSETPLPDGSMQVTYLDASGKTLSFVAPPERYRREVDRDVWGNPGEPGKETYTLRIAKAPGQERIRQSLVDPKSIKFDPSGNNLKIRYTDAANNQHETRGRIVLGAGQDLTNSQHTMWGENFTASEKRLSGKVHFGFTPNQPAQDVDIARQIFSLRWNVGTDPKTGKPLHVDLDLDSNVTYVGPGTKREDGVLIGTKILKLVQSPNTSPDSLAALGAASREYGHVLGKTIIGELKDRPAMGKPLPADPATIDLGAILPDYAPTQPTMTVLPKHLTPPHFRDLSATGAPSLRILSEGLFSEAGRLFGNFKVKENPRMEENRIELKFFRDAQSGEIIIAASRLAGGEPAQSRLIEFIGADKKFMAQVDAWMRGHDSPITMWLPFDSKGAFRPDLVRVSTPLETVVKYFREGYTMKQILEILPRPVTVAPEDLMLPWVEGNYRNLYEVVGGPDGRKVHVSPTGVDAESKKRFWIVSAQEPNSGPDAPLKKQVAVVEYEHTNQEVGVQSIVGAQIFMEQGLGAELANMPERAAQGLVGRRDTLKPEYRLFVVYQIINDGGILSGDKKKAQDPKILSDLASALSRVHKKNHDQTKPFSEAAENWMKAELTEMKARRPGISDKALAELEGLLRSEHFAGKMAHGDPRLVHIVAGNKGVNFAGMHEVYKYKHPLQDLKTLLQDLKKEIPQLAGLGPSTPDSRDVLIAAYAKESGLTGRSQELLMEWLRTWKY